MFPALHNAGMPPLDVLRAVTTTAGELLGWQDRVGAVEPGPGHLFQVHWMGSFLMLDLRQNSRSRSVT